ncbi:hypothetical protein ABT288_23175 [Streptomyces sp. NPDC001093]|uniref:hypothetical protein n=1 Tax=Streptomyces sp. NPDC001093 TaxID=3154376 RepID=UPI0033169509
MYLLASSRAAGCGIEGPHVARNTCFAARIQQRVKRLSEALGEQVWRGPGLEAFGDIDELRRTVTSVEEHNVEPSAGWKHAMPNSPPHESRRPGADQRSEPACLTVGSGRLAGRR